MTITLLAPDGVAITAQQERQARAAQHGGGSGRQLGGRSGFRVGTPGNVLSATSTTWTLGPCAAIIDPGAATHQGMYGWSNDSNVTGTVTAADATYARKDIVYIQINDSTSGDGSGEVTYAPKYMAGSASSAPVSPWDDPVKKPPRSFLVGTITVPPAGGGSPSVQRNQAVYVSAGASLPVFTGGERDALTAYDGLTVLRADVAGWPRETYASGLWYREGVGVHLELARTASANLANSLWGPGSPSELAAGVDATASRNPSLFSYPTNNQITVTQEGIYSPAWAITDFSPAGSGFMIIRKVSSGQSIASQQFTATGDASCSRGSIRLAAGETLQFNFQTNAVVTCKHLISISKIG